MWHATAEFLTKSLEFSLLLTGGSVWAEVFLFIILNHSWQQMRTLRPYEQILDTNVLLRFVLPLCVGIAVGEMSCAWLTPHIAMLSVLLAVATVATAVCAFAKSVPLHRPFFHVFFNVAVGLLGAWLLVINRSSEVAEWENEAVVRKVMIVETPRETPKTFRAMAEVLRGDGCGRKVNLSLMRSATDTLQPGDVLWLKNRMTPPKNTGNPGEFDYATWLRRQGVSGAGLCFAGQWKNFGSTAPLPPKVAALRLRGRWVQEYERAFGREDFAVLSALTLGDKTHLTEPLRKRYSDAGVSHLLALSGLHLAILFGIYRVLVLSHCRRRGLYVAMSALGMAAVWGFVLLCGMPLSLLRAAVMFTVMQLCRCLRRDTSSVNNLALAALLLLLFSPQALMDVGFQLSFVATLCILLFGGEGDVVRLPEQKDRWRPLRQSVRISLCAQVGTAPLVAYYFHTLPVWALVANVLAVPLAYGVLVLGLLFLLLPFLSSPLSVCLSGCLWLLHALLDGVGRLPFSTLEVYPSAGTVALMFVLLAFLATYAVQRRARWLYAGGGVLLLMGCVAMLERQSVSPRVAFYHLSTPSVHCISEKNRSYLWTLQGQKVDSVFRYVRRDFWLPQGMAEPLWLEHPDTFPELVYTGRVMSFGGCRIALSDSTDVLGRETMEVDVLFVLRGGERRPEALLRRYRPKRVVLEERLSDRWRERWHREAEVRGLPVHDIARDGALVLPVGR